MFSRWELVFTLLSWLIVIALAVGASALWLSPLTTGGPAVSVLGAYGARIFYSVLYGGQGLVLLFSTLTHHETLRKNILLCIYLTGLFTSILTIVLTGGFTFSVIDNLSFALLSAGCWLYWKFRTEYLAQEDISSGNLKRR